MRTFSLFLRYTFLLGVVAFLLYLVVPRVMLSVASSQIIQATESFEDRGSAQSSYANRCTGAPAASTLSKPLALQLRFIDEKNYVIEVVCSFIEDTPVPLTVGVLPMFVTKVPGASGLTVDIKEPSPSSFRLQSFSQTKDLTFDGTKVVQASLPTAPMGVLPQTACTGYGYQCCDSGTQAGVGEGRPATDCAASCFSMCKNLPYILSFSGDPYPINQEIIMTSDSVDVTFTYAADLVGGTIAGVMIDYGDGSQETSTLATGVFTHTFTCPQSCRIPVTIQAMDTAGNASVANDNATLYIKRE